MISWQFPKLRPQQQMNQGKAGVWQIPVLTSLAQALVLAHGKGEAGLIVLDNLFIVSFLVFIHSFEQNSVALFITSMRIKIKGFQME